jgi:hypothetical protein
VPTAAGTRTSTERGRAERSISRRPFRLTPRMSRHGRSVAEPASTSAAGMNLERHEVRLSLCPSNNSSRVRMTSLGEADIMSNSWIAGRVRVLSIYADNALYPRLGMTLGVTLNDLSNTRMGGPSGPSIEWHGVTGELRLGDGGSAIGLLAELSPRRPIRPTSFTSESQVRIVCELDPWRLEVIERHRNGAALNLWLELWPRLITTEGPADGIVQSLRLSIPREAWLDFLGKVAGSQFDVLEIRYSPREAEHFQRAIARTREARAQISAGEYDSAVAECRKVLEALKHELKEEGQPDPFQPLFEQRTDPRRAKEYLGIISRIKQLSGFVHHDFGTSLTYSRAEAQFLLRTTESILALVGNLTVTNK